MTSPSSRRDQVMSVLRDAPEPMSIVEVAGRLGVHANTARFHLDALVESGRVERLTPPSDGPGRPPLRFRAVPGMDPGGRRNYQLLAGVLVDSLAEAPDATERAIDSGRAWGRRLVASVPRPRTADDATDRLVDVLDDLGFEPERRTADGHEQIGLRHCPFLELARGGNRIVCPVHLGLMQGAMESLSDAVTVEALQPYAEPDLCVTHLGAAAGRSTPAR